MVLPNLIIIGSPKCATTSLHFYLSVHPQIWMSAQKELHFFLSQASWGSWNRGLDWYCQQFQDGADCLIRGESSPGYSVEGYSQDSAEKMAALLPNAKLIYMVRDPIARVRSHYLEEVYNGHISSKLTLDHILTMGDEAPDPMGFNYRSMVYTSLYYKQLSIYLQKFDLKKIHLISMESFLKDDVACLSSIFKFLEVKDVMPDNLDVKLNVNSQKRLRFINPTGLVRQLPKYEKFSTLIPFKVKSVYRTLISRSIDQKAISRISPENEEKLRDLFAPDVARLRTLTGQAFPEWSL